MVVIKNIFGEVIKEYPELDTLAGADLSFEELSYADFRGMDLSNTCFEHAELDGAEFDDWVFDGANFDAPDFTNTYYELEYCGGGGSHSHKEFRGY